VDALKIRDVETEKHTSFRSREFQLLVVAAVGHSGCQSRGHDPSTAQTVNDSSFHRVCVEIQA
jgi:hypothetical protein